MGDSRDPIDETGEILAILPIRNYPPNLMRSAAVALYGDVGSLSSMASTMEQFKTMNPVTPKQAKRELEKLHKALCALDDALIELSVTASEQLDETRKELIGWSTPPIDSFRLDFALRYPKLALTVAEAARRAEYSTPSVGRGRRRKLGPKLITNRLALYYHCLTGMRPTRRTDYDDGRAYGPFLEFVEKIFDLWELDGSPQYCTSEAVKDYDETLGSYQASIEDKDDTGLSQLWRKLAKIRELPPLA